LPDAIAALTGLAPYEWIGWMKQGKEKHIGEEGPVSPVLPGPLRVLRRLCQSGILVSGNISWFMWTFAGLLWRGSVGSSSSSSVYLGSSSQPRNTENTTYEQ